MLLSASLQVSNAVIFDTQVHLQQKAPLSRGPVQHRFAVIMRAGNITV